MTRVAKSAVNLKPFLAKTGPGRTVAAFRKKETVFSQGEPADAVLYLLKGQVKLTVVSQQGKEAVIAMLGPDDFLGEGSPRRPASSHGDGDRDSEGSLLKLERKTIVRLLHDQPTFSELFMTYLLARNVRIEEDLVDQLFNSSEKRLARILLLLSRVGTAKDEARGDPQGQSRNAGRDDWHYPRTREFLHEQVQETRVHRVQRRAECPQFACECRPLRQISSTSRGVGTPSSTSRGFPTHSIVDPCDISYSFPLRTGLRFG